MMRLQKAPMAAWRWWWAALALISLCAVAAEPIQAPRSRFPVPPGWAGWHRMVGTGAVSSDGLVAWPEWLRQVWAREIAEADRYARQEAAGNPRWSRLGSDGHASADALYAVFHDGGRAVVVTMFDFLPICAAAPSHFASDQIHDECPLRLAVFEGNRLVSNREVRGADPDLPPGCFLFVEYARNLREPPSTRIDPVNNTVLVRYDRRAGVIDVTAIRAGRQLRDCTISARISG